MRSLLDVNVLLALFDPLHVHNDVARQWWARNREAGWDSCPLTQNGFVRIVSQPSYPNMLPTGKAIDLLLKQTSRPDHVFWADDISLTFGGLFDGRRMLRSSQVTDNYLLGLAVKNGGSLATFDRAITTFAVRGATSEHLVVLG